MKHSGEECDALSDLLRKRLSDEEAARLEASIEADPQLEAEYRLIAALGDTDAADTPFPGAAGWARLSRAIDEETPRFVWQRRVPVWQAAACVAIAIAVWQITAAPLLQGGLSGAERYITATGKPASAPARAHLRLAFVPEAPAAAIEKLLRNTGGEVIGGPSAVGLYTIGFENESARDAATTKMKATPSVIALVEDVASNP